MVNLIRSLAEVQRVVALNAPRSIVLRGTADQSALSDWLVQQLDKPAGSANPNTTSVAYQMPADAYSPPFVRLFYPSRIDSPQALQDLCNVVRSTTKIQRSVAYAPTKALGMRATSDQIARAEQILQERDKQHQ
jgi:hypothetical protein